MDIDSLTVAELKHIKSKYNIECRSLKKVDLVEGIKKCCNAWKKFRDYTYIKQLGSAGKDGRTFKARHDNGKIYAIKIFKDSKSPNSIEREIELQQKASQFKICPRIHDYDADGRYIVMDMLDTTLYDIFLRQNGQLTDKQQITIIKLFQQLDECNVFHADPNPLNFMQKNNKWFIIDFGFSKHINSKCIKKYGANPNMKYMPSGLVVYLRRINPEATLEILSKYSFV
jgi:serine/threonine protein kinase